MMSELRELGLGAVGAAGWEVINTVALAAGSALLLLRTISWHIPVTLLGGLLLASGSCHLVNPDLFPSPLFHLFSGGTMLAAFFIATDPVSSPANPNAKLAYGVMLGMLIFSMRTWGGFPEAVAFAVLVMNALTPMLDMWLKPRVLGT
jgi:electron transport complex protein RnfD